MIKAIEIIGLQKEYGDIHAIKNITFSVEKNSFFAFLGPNGAGKSSTINIISTLLKKDNGSVKVLGYEVGKEDNKIRERIGIVFQTSVLDKTLTVKENLLIRSSFYRMNKRDFNIRIEEINEYLDIIPFFEQRYGSLSGGQKRKADMARALLNWPELLILDEPTTGLDPKSRKDIWKLISRLRSEKEITIFLTTHYMEEVVDANKIVLINEGKLVAIGTAEELRQKYSRNRLKIILSSGLEDEFDCDNVNYYIVNDTINIDIDTCYSGISLINKYQKHIKEFEILRGDMDNVFLNITGRKLGEVK